MPIVSPCCGSPLPKQYRCSIGAGECGLQTEVVEKMLIPILIFVLSLAATLQFTIFSWRARLLRFTSESLASQANLNAARLLTDKSFMDVATYQELCPSLDGGSAPKLGAVRLYHNALKLLGSPDWAKAEMALCARYASAVLTQRMQRNQVLAAEVCSF